MMRRLAEFNAASIDVNWIEKIPLLKSDNFFELNPSPHSFYTMCVEAFSAAAALLVEFYPDSKLAANWLLSSHSFAKLIEFSKPSQDSLNVLAHGDFWINNMMFKEQPLDVCFIDFQLCRYVHPTRDILHVMYTCLDRKFRIQHEAEMLEVRLLCVLYLRSI
jgi:aminoglycoside phosphotransferase (APT) family kinase protein